MESYWPVVEDECKAVAEFQIKGQAAVVTLLNRVSVRGLLVGPFAFRHRCGVEVSEHLDSSVGDIW